MNTICNQLVVRPGAGKRWAAAISLPAVGLIVGASIALLARSHAAAILAVANTIPLVLMSAHGSLYALIGWTYIILCPLALWVVALTAAVVLQAGTGIRTLQAGGAITTRRLTAQLDIAQNLAPMIGLLGTVWHLGEATRAMTAEHFETAVMTLAPAVGEALYSTIAGLSIAIVAFVAARGTEVFRSTGPSGRGKGAVVMSLLVVSATPAGADEQDLYSLPLAVVRAWDRAASHVDGGHEASHAARQVACAGNRAAASHEPARPQPARPEIDHSREAIRRLIHRVALREGVDPLFAEALAWAESSLNPAAVSPNGCCVGLFQLHHRTARELGVKDILDPATNAAAGLRYFRRQAVRFGSVAVALVAYNAGPTIASRWVANPAAGNVPAETDRFVEHVISTHRRLSAQPR